MNCLVDEGMLVYTRRKPLIDKALSSASERDAAFLQALIVAKPNFECGSISPFDVQSTSSSLVKKVHNANR